MEPETAQHIEGNIVLGVRVEPARVRWAIVSGTVDEPLLVADEKISAPKVMDNDLGAALVWYRDRLGLVISNHSPSVFALRTAEPIARQGNRAPDRARARLEGVLIEVASRSGLRILTADLKVISARLGSPKAKHYLEDSELRGINWAKRDAAQREAILVATAGLSQ